MEKLGIKEVFDWLWSHAPGIAIIGMFLASACWVTIQLNNFSHRINSIDTRLGATERLCNDIHTRQIPEMRAELKAEIKEVSDRLARVENILIKIDTYLSTTSENYPKSQK